MAPPGTDARRLIAIGALISRQHGGLGLGLAIVRHLVELHGGTVRVESAGLEKGATFTVSLPSAGCGAAVSTGGGHAPAGQ